jgi:hypothetical protein
MRGLHWNAFEEDAIETKKATAGAPSRSPVSHWHSLNSRAAGKGYSVAKLWLGAADKTRLALVSALSLMQLAAVSFSSTIRIFLALATIRPGKQTIRASTNLDNH